MIFKTYNSKYVAQVFFNGYFFGSVFLSLVSLYGFVSGAGISSTLSGFMYLLVVSLLSLKSRFRKSNFSVPICIFTLLYLNIPTAFILFEGNDYIFGEGLISIPFAQSDYRQSLSFGFLYLTVFWVAVWLGIISVGTKIKNVDLAHFSPIETRSILLLGIIVFVVAWIDNQSYDDVRLEGAEKTISLLAFIFFDHAYLVMAGLVLFFKLNEPKHIKNPKKITTLIFTIFITFTFLAFVSGGSKAAILIIFILFLLLPFSAFREYPYAQVSFPSIKFIMVLMFLAPLLFYFALIQRISLSSGIAPDLSTFLTGLSEFDTNVGYDIIKQILYRLSWGGLDRFLLVVQSFSVNSFDPDTAGKFAIYLAKNTLNLLLPGTPFLESYAPSSQLFLEVINKNLVGGEIDANTLIISLNTQPYTIFGIFIILLGFFAPVCMYIYVCSYVYVYNKINSAFIRISMLYFFMGTLSSYGIETNIGNSVHLVLSIFFMYFVLKILSQFRTGLPFTVRQ